jgi:serine/alanine adding enzyme
MKKKNWKQLALSGAYRAGLFEMGRFVRRDLIPILCYHRFSADGSDGNTPIRLFERHLQYLKKRFTPVTFKDIAAMKRGTVSIDFPVIVTVDDGYADFLERAFPLLKAYNFPATLFVTTRFVDGDSWLWPDVINYAISRTNKYKLVLADFGISLPLDTAQKQRAARTFLHEFYKKLSLPAKSYFLKKLPQTLRVTIPDSPTSDFRAVTWDQLKDACQDLLEAGSHTLNHHILSDLQNEQVQVEVEESKKRIQAKLDRPVISFAYPNGMEGDYRESDKAAIKRTGYLFAVSCTHGFNSLSSDPFALKRIVAPAELPAFAREVSGFELLIHKNSASNHHTGTKSIISPNVGVCICSDDVKAKWDAFVLSHTSGSIFLQYDWKQVFEKTYGNRCYYLLAEEKETPVGVLPLVFKNSRIFGKFLVSLPYFDSAGTCTYRDDACAALLSKAAEVARQTKADYIELRHTRKVFPDLPSKEGKVTMMLELPSDADRLWSDLRAKVRNQVRKAYREELSVASGKGELLDDFFSIYTKNMRDLGSPSHRKQFFQYICEFFPEAVRIFSVRRGETPLAAGFTLASRDTLTIPWASALREHNSKCPNMLLYWSILKYASERGFLRFCFGRSTPGEGTYLFKRQWGAYPVQLYWHYWLPEGKPLPNLSISNSKYGLPVKVWKNLPVSVTRKLGPHVIQNLA